MRNSTHAIRATAPPPTPLNSATICGIAVILASANVVGGFVVTDRMLEMFKKRETPAREGKPADGARGNPEVPPEA